MFQNVTIAGDPHLSKLLSSLALGAALSALGFTALSCSSTGTSNIRVINAISDSGPTDIEINGTKIATSLAFGGVYPAPATPVLYLPVGSGNTTIDGYAPGTTTNPIAPIGTFSLNGSTDYTLVAGGLELNEAPPFVITDNNHPPASNNLEFRFINASLNSQSTYAKGLDVYIVPPGTDITAYSPQISGLGYGQSSPYQLVSALSGGYNLIVTAYLGKTPIIPAIAATGTAGTITTVVILDNAGTDNGISNTPLILHDLN